MLYQNSLSLMAILAHPDDESLGFGGTLAHYANEGVATHLLCATRGERGWMGDPAENPGETALGQIREAELCQAAHHLGLHSVTFLDYIDGDLDQADHAEATRKIAREIRLRKPDVVLTFDPNGEYGHPDHIAISQLSMAAIVAAADPDYTELTELPAHIVSKLYYRAGDAEETKIYESIFGELMMDIDGVQRRSVSWQDWAITTTLDVTPQWQTVWQAVLCHQSQIPAYGLLEKLPEATHARLWGQQNFYRVFSLVNGGRQVERDLFIGLR